MNRAARRFFLAGASAFAILAGASAAQAVTYTIPGEDTFVAPVAGTYAIDVWGAQGGASSATSGGLGAGVGVDVTLSAGQDVFVYVGGQGAYGGRSHQKQPDRRRTRSIVASSFKQRQISKSSLTFSSAAVILTGILFCGGDSCGPVGGRT